MLCQKMVPLYVTPQGRMMSNTYCMLKLGHEGKCDSNPTTGPLTTDSESDKLKT